jgi:hypothetical protein
MFTDVSAGLAAFIIRAMNKLRARNRCEIALMMEAASTSEPSVNF